MHVNYAEDITEKDLIEVSLDWQLQGLRQTASGYGNKLTTRYKVLYRGRMRRVHAICHSNVASLYIVVQGERLFLKV